MDAAGADVSQRPGLLEIGIILAVILAALTLALRAVGD
jgi:hypothetical protein